MKTNKTKSRALKNALFAGTIISGFMGTGVFAQESSSASETVVVTGSRISRPNLTAPVAISTFTAEKIAATGEQNVAEILRSLPSTGVSTLSAANSNFLTAGAGINTIELRNLGESRTLVLMNGRRFVTGQPGTQNVDLNTIPAEFIQRIDVVTGGASAVYGSDALAGVVNIITKKKFDGLEIATQMGQSLDYNDDKRSKISITGGSNFANDKGSAIFNLTWDTQDEIAAKNRPTTEGDFSWNFPTTGNLSDFVGPAFSSFIPQGRFILPTNLAGGTMNRVIQDDGSVTPYVAARDGFNRNAQRLLVVPSQRIMTSFIANYDVNRFAQIFTEFNFAQTTSDSSFEPVPYSSEDAYQDNLPVCGDVDFDGIDDGTCAFGVKLTNPLIPTAMKTELRALFPGYTDDKLVIGFARRLSDIAKRGNQAERQTFRSVFGVKGDIGDTGFTYEASVNYGKTTDFQTSSGDVDNVKVALALDAITDGAGNVVCADATARSLGCVPLNIFGRNKISEEAAKYVGIQTNRFQKAEQLVINTFMSGELFQMPAGGVKTVFGFEYREENSADIPDPLTQSGGASGNATPATVGSFYVKEFFTEARVPLLKDMSLVKTLDLNLAARFSDYSTVGKTNAYAASLEYVPTDWIRFRTQYSKAVRAPNISELFQPLTQDFPNVTDPCAGVTRTTSGQAAFKTVRGSDGNDPGAVISSTINASTIDSQAAKNCLADPAVAARVLRDGALALTQPETQGVSGFDGGSTALGVETADTVSFGFVVRPTFYDWMKNLSVSVDYYKIKIEDVIDVLDEQLSADKCYTGAASYVPSSVFCANIVRFANGPQTGALRYVNQQNQNLGSKTAEGVDVQADYAMNVSSLPFLNKSKDYGRLSWGLNYSYIEELTTVPYVGAEEDEHSVDAGTIGASKNEWLLSTTYKFKKLAVNWETQYVGHAYVTNDVNGGSNYGVTVGGKFIRAEVDPQVFHNMQVKYNITNWASLTLGIDNVFDEYVLFGGTQVPPGPNPPLADKPTGWSTFPDVYDALRRRGYLGLRLKF